MLPPSPGADAAPCLALSPHRALRNRRSVLRISLHRAVRYRRRVRRASRHGSALSLSGAAAFAAPGS